MTSHVDASERDRSGQASLRIMALTLVVVFVSIAVQLFASATAPADDLGLRLLGAAVAQLN